MRTRSRHLGSEGKRSWKCTGPGRQPSGATQTAREDAIRRPGRGQIAMALRLMLKCLDSITYAMGGCWRGGMWGAGRGVGWSQLQSGFGKCLQLLWGATWTVLNKEESYSLKQWQSASVTCFLQLMMLASNSPNPSFFVKVDGGCTVLYFSSTGDQAGGETPEEHRVASGSGLQKHPGNERCCQPCPEVSYTMPKSSALPSSRVWGWGRYGEIRVNVPRNVTKSRGWRRMDISQTLLIYSTVNKAFTSQSISQSVLISINSICVHLETCSDKPFKVAKCAILSLIALLKSGS